MLCKRHKTFFLTGATGLIGSYLLKLLLEDGFKVFCLVRGKGSNTALSRVLEVLKFWNGEKMNEGLDNLTVIEGDITFPSLWRDQKVGARLNDAENIEIIHMAAATDFKCPANFFKETNVVGTENVLKYAMTLHKKKKLRKVNYISSIYVCGNYQGEYCEGVLDVGQKFTIPYEQSKFHAEKLARRYRNSGLWIDIFRVPAVVGDSKTGKILGFNHAFYQGLRVLNLGIFDCLPCKDAQLNMAYIDELCESMQCLIASQSERNQCYHLCAPQPFPIEVILSTTCHILKINKPKFINFKEFAKKKWTPAQLMMLGYNYMFFSRKLRINSEFTNEILKKNNFIFSGYSRNGLHKLIDYAEKSGFLKKRHILNIS